MITKNIRLTGNVVSIVYRVALAATLIHRLLRPSPKQKKREGEWLH